MKTWHPLTRLLVLIAVPVLIAAWLIPISNPTVTSSVQRTDAEGEAAPGDAGPTAPVPDIESLSATIERPLFSPTRRLPAPPAPVAEVEEPPPAGPSPPTFSLRGIARSGSGPIAVVEVAGGGSARLRVGEEYDGWTVRAIDARSVTLEAGAEQTVMTVFRRSGEP
jgi:hypothetical protein